MFLIKGFNWNGTWNQNVSFSLGFDQLQDFDLVDVCMVWICRCTKKNVVHFHVDHHYCTLVPEKNTEIGPSNCEAMNCLWDALHT